MIILTKLNDEPILINPWQIEFIELIPESKITMMNTKYHLVKESKEEIVAKILAFNNQWVHRTATGEA